MLCRGKLIWRHEDHALWTESFLLANPVGQWYSLSHLSIVVFLSLDEENVTRTSLTAVSCNAHPTVKLAACQLGGTQKQVTESCGNPESWLLAVSPHRTIQLGPSLSLLFCA